MYFIKNFHFINFYTSQQKNELKIFFALSLIAMTLEIFGIGLIIPFLTIMIDPIYSKQLINFINNFGFSLSSQKDLILFLITLILLVFFIKTINLSYISFKQIKFLINLKTEVSNKLYRIYLLKPFIFHLDNNSSKLIRDLNDSTQVLTVTKSILTLIAEITVILGIISLMVFLEPMLTTLSLLLVFSSGYLFYFLIQKRAYKWGEDRKRHEGIRLQWLQQGFSSIKEIKIMNKLEFYIKSFSSQNKFTNDAQFKQDFALSLPRLWLELLTVIGFSVLLFLMIDIKNEVSNLIPILGFFTAAAFKIIPSATKIINSLQLIKFGLPVAKTYIQEFINFDEKVSTNESLEKLEFKKIIEVNNINFTYPNSNKKILNNININIPYGSSIGIYGESGVGKSTFMNVFLQLLKPQSGKIILDGKDIINSTREWQNIIGYVPQNVHLNDDTLIKNIALGLADDQIDIKKINDIVRMIKLDTFINNLSEGFYSKVGEFGDRISGGQKQRIGIARALYNNPQILVLDEYTNALDPETEEQIIKEVNSLKLYKTIITITHKNSSLKYCDEIYQLTYEHGLIKNKLQI